MAEKLTEPEIRRRLDDHPGWSIIDGRLHRVFEFADFVEAFGFMSRVALVAESLFHHPDWSNSWNRVEIDIVDHEAGGISDRCLELVGRIDRL